ncbi:MAG TPA: hypothetical protein VN658_02550 [Candidatus Acidoferrales bacterium]|nr:hypothetical protein [Candidatus Acidoferrales bacterium]
MAVAMLWLGIGIGFLTAASFILNENSSSSSLPALATFGLFFVGNAAWKLWRANKAN